MACRPKRTDLGIAVKKLQNGGNFSVAMLGCVRGSRPGPSTTFLHMPAPLRLLATRGCLRRCVARRRPHSRTHYWMRDSLPSRLVFICQTDSFTETALRSCATHTPLMLFRTRSSCTLVFKCQTGCSPETALRNCATHTPRRLICTHRRADSSSLARQAFSSHSPSCRLVLNRRTGSSSFPSSLRGNHVSRCGK